MPSKPSTRTNPNYETNHAAADGGEDRIPQTPSTRSFKLSPLDHPFDGSVQPFGRCYLSSLKQPFFKVIHGHSSNIVRIF